ncbi:MAG: hypothetical protein K8F91_11860 [Candidatus Obscuribacterales bacterium]|nr:hypothetical protein [Candidatus Obscuribacterales bacterium]
MHKTAKLKAALISGSGRVSASGCYGRLLRTLDGKPQALSDDLDRRVVMVMGPTGLASLAGKSGFEIVVTIGYPLDYIERKRSQGYRFQLVLFNKPVDSLKLATWKNTIEAVCQAYPELASILADKWQVLKAADYEELERLAGYSFSVVDSIGPADPRFMTIRRLFDSERSLVDIRSFLYHTVRLNELYTGTGRTLTCGGLTGVSEYITANHSISRLEDFDAVDLEISLRETTGGAL